MTTINLVEICRLKYPNQIELGNIGFRKPDQDILISYWNVQGVTQPLESDLLAESATWEPIYQMAQLKQNGSEAIEDLLNTTAKVKNYNDSISIASYSASTNAVWKAEADAFIAWRDAVWVSALQTFADVQAGTIPAPTLADFLAGLPTITWP